MTPQQIALLTSIGDNLREKPQSWKNISAQHKQIIETFLKPSVQGFSKIQKNFISNWWLKLNEGDVQLINSILPKGFSLEPLVDKNKNIFCSADYLTDVLKDGRLKKLESVFENMILVYLTSKDWLSTSKDWLPFEINEESL